MSAGAFQVATTIKDLSKPSIRARDGMLVLALETSWENYLSPAPMCIALLGEVQLVACSKDFSIKESAPTGGFQYVKYPDSFRACMVQVTNEGWGAFDTAHRNMSQIMLLSQGIPTQIGDVFKTIVMGSSQEVEGVLPGILSRISSDAQECENLGLQADKRFADIMDLTGELLEVCTQQRGVTQNKNTAAKQALAAKENIKKVVDEQRKSKEKYVAELSEAAKKADQRVDDTIKKMPSGWDMIGMNIVESLGKTVTSSLDRAMSMGLPMLMNMATKDKNVGAVLQSAGNSIPQQGSQPAKVPEAIDKSLDQADLLLSLTQALQKIDPKSKEVTAKGPAYVLEMMTDMKRTLDALPKTPSCTQAINVLSKGMTLAQEMSKFSSQMNIPDDQMNKFRTEGENLSALAQSLVVQKQMSRSRDLAPTVSPGQYATMQQGDGKLSAGEMAQKNWQMTLETSQKMMEDTRKRYDEQSEELTKIQNRQAELMEQMAKIKIETVEFDQIIEVLKKGIMAIAELREQWAAMIRFFSMLAGIVKVCNSSVQSLTERVQKFGEIRLSSGTMSSMAVDMIYEMCIKADQVSRIVAMISETYVDVSQKYIMGPLSALAKIAAMDVSKEGAQITQMQAKLLSEAKGSTQAIINLVQKHKREFGNELQSRQKTVQNALQGMIPPPDASIKKAVQDASQHVKDNQREADRIREETRTQTGLDASFFG